MTDALLECGPSMQGAPVTWQEVEAWARMTRTEVPGYEAILIRDLSIEYCNAFAQFDGQNVGKPVDESDEERNYRKDTSVQFDRLFDHLKAKPKP